MNGLIPEIWRFLIIIIILIDRSCLEFLPCMKFRYAGCVDGIRHFVDKIVIIACS